MAKKSKRRCDTLPVLHPDAAGIDVGASELYVAVSADRDPQPDRTRHERNVFCLRRSPLAEACVAVTASSTDGWRLRSGGV